MKHFFIIANPMKDPGLQNAGWVRDFLTEEGCFCRMDEKRSGGKEGRFYTDMTEIPPQTECILVLGGDGTLIEAARDTSRLKIPLLGINIGTLGFLAEVDIGSAREALKALIEDRYHLESRMMLTGRILRKEETRRQADALNDIVITRSGSLQILHFSIYVNGRFLNEYNADGVIISTPTGSTGYNMSAGGPIVEPRAQILVVTPICPHTLNTRSIVLSAEDEILVEMSGAKKGGELRAEVNFDGGHAEEVLEGDRVCVTRSKRTTEIVKLSQTSFLEVLHRKMSEG